MVLCLENFVDFPEYEITKGKITAETIIDIDKVSVKLGYPLTIKKGDSVSRIKDFEIEIPIGLGIVYSSAQKIVNSSMEDICLSCIADIAFESDLTVDIFDYDNETVIFIVKDENSEINGKPFEWIFANVY